MTYRIIFDEEHIEPYQWLIQEKPLFGKWRFRTGFFKSQEDAQRFMDGWCFKSYKGPVFNTYNYF